MNTQTTSSPSTIETSAESPADNELVARMLQQDTQALVTVMRRYNQRLYRIARSILKNNDEAQDAVQETYITAYYQLDQLKEPNGLAGWLSRIVRNEAMMRIRKSSRIVYLSDEANNKLDNTQSTDPQPSDTLANQQLSTLIEDAIDLLPVKYRSVYVMRAIQQLSTAETACSLEISEDAVKKQYSRAKSALRQRLETYLETAGLQVFEFAGSRCDYIVQNVLEKIKS